MTVQIFARWERIMRAIETPYKGYNFRSRLEARWAIYFDALGVRWDYEPEGFTFGKTTYLPDFKIQLSSGTYWVEIKPLEWYQRWSLDIPMYPRCDGEPPTVPTIGPLIVLYGSPGTWEEYKTELFAMNWDDPMWLAHCPLCDKVDITFSGWAGYIRGCRCDYGPGKSYKLDGTATPKMLEAIKASRRARYRQGRGFLV